jgi:mediator of RNA polymerase II transcription subunit 13
MEAPMISIGKGEAVIQVLPPALRFWEKLGLSPKGGRKSVATFIMFEENARKQPLYGEVAGGF